MRNRSPVSSFQQAQNMSLEPLMRRMGKALTPTPQLRREIEQRIAMRLGEPHSLREGNLITIPDGVKEAVWRRVASRIGVMRAASLLTQLRELLTPRTAPRKRMQVSLSERLAATPQPTYTSERFKWVAATVAAALVITSSPAFFLTGTTVAVSHVLVLPTQGTVEFSRDRIEWQPLAEQMILEPGMSVRTTNGNASIVYRDDAVLRLDQNTVVETRDTSELLEPAPEVVPSFALTSGRVWVQGLLPDSVRGMTLTVPMGTVTVHEGSVDIHAQAEATQVSVWDRHADVVHAGTELLLVSGERVRLDDQTPAVTAIPEDENDEGWSDKNLSMDAVHRRQIALEQKQRRAASAGILPTSTLYPVKRMAEEVDVFLTFNEEDKVQKKLDLANQRLNEAAAMLLTGAGSGADITQSLATYSAALTDIAADSGSTVAQFLIRQSLTETIADVTALQPDDESYVLKKAVIEATSQFPDETLLNQRELQAMLFVDSLAMLNDAVAVGNADQVQETWAQLSEYVDLVEQEDSPLPDGLRKEAQALLGQFAETVSENDQAVAALDESILAEIIALGPQDLLPVPSGLSAEEVNQLAQAIYDRIYSYRMPRSRLNQLQLELNATRGNADEGSILRALHTLLPAQSQLSDNVRKDLARLRWQRAGEEYVESAPAGQTASGAAL